jgi:hypothetical protein
MADRFFFSYISENFVFRASSPNLLCLGVVSWFFSGKASAWCVRREKPPQPKLQALFRETVDGSESAQLLFPSPKICHFAIFYIS